MLFFKSFLSLPVPGNFQRQQNFCCPLQTARQPSHPSAMSSTGTASVSPVPSVFETPHSSSTSNLASRSRNSSTSRPRPRGVRTNIACKACQKRKTKVSAIHVTSPSPAVSDKIPQCSGGPAPCELCTKFATHCHFNPKLDTRRKVSYKSSEKHDIRGYILESTLQVLKRGKADCVEGLLRTIRSDAPIEDIARSFQQNFKLLQNRGIIPPFKIDESDIISLALQGLFPYRVGCVQGDIESDNETVHVPQSSPSQQSYPYPDYQNDPFVRSCQRPRQFQDPRKSPIDPRAGYPNIVPSTSFTSTACSNLSDDSYDCPVTPISQSPTYLSFDSHTSRHLTPYSSGNQPQLHNAYESHHQYLPNGPVLVSQPLLDKPAHLQQNMQNMPSNWSANMHLNAPSMSWHQSPHGAVTSTGVPVQLVSHNEPSIYGGWPT